MPDNAAPLILLTRPRAASERFAKLIESRMGDVPVVIAPLMEIAPTVTGLSLEGVAALVFTSAAGVEVFGDLTERRNLPAWCVGDRTASAAREIGLKALSAGGNADALIDLIAEARPTGRLLHLHGAHVRGDVAERLTQAGLRAEGRAIYDQTSLQPPAEFLTLLRREGPVILPLFSPRSAGLVAEAVNGAKVRATLHVIAMSPAVAEAVPSGFAQDVQLADSPDAQAMIRALVAAIPHPYSP